MSAIGRPKSVSPPKEECERLGKDFVEWASEVTEEKRMIVGQWWALRHGMCRSEWDALRKCVDFVRYYDQGCQALAVKAIDGTMKEGFGHRYLRIYDQELTEAENAQKKWESDLKSKENEKAGAEFFAKADLFLNQIDRLQQARQKAED